MVKGGVSVKALRRVRICAAVFFGILLYQAPKLVFAPDWVQPAFAEPVFSVELSPAEDEKVSSLSTDINTMLQVEILRESATLPPPYSNKRVLIYHTHTYEAYEQAEDDPYKQIEKWRTSDAGHNVVAVGKALAAALQALGIQVVHDTTAYEPPTLEDAYNRSLEMLEERGASGEKYDLYIDLHRDAIASSSTIRRTVNIGGVDVARFMVLIGKGTTGGYAVKPDWEKNLVLAECITAALNQQCENLARDVKIKTGRFNQHIADCCVLIECGMNTNTLEEVLAGIPYLAEAIAYALSSE